MNKFFILIIIAGFIFTGCEINTPALTNTDEQEQTTSKLAVWLYNDAVSAYSITSIQTLVMEKAGGEYIEPNGTFSANYLNSNEKIAPGDSIFFEVEMPNLYYAYCNLGVDDGNGNTIILTQQENYPNAYDGTITYWGSDRRQVFVTLKQDTYYGYIRPMSWGEWAY